MIDKEVAELRRRYRQDRSNITKIHGCYVNVHGELVSAFTLSMGRRVSRKNIWSC